MTATITDHDITASVFANILRVIEEATHEDDGSLSEEAQEEIDDYLELLGAQGMPEIRHLVSSEERLPLEALSQESEWHVYQGPHGGKGWKNARAQEIVYGGERPGTKSVAEKVGHAAGKKTRALSLAVLHEMKPSSILERIKQTAHAVRHPIETVRKVKEKAVEKYKWLEQRYGRPAAIAIAGAYAGYYVALSLNPIATMAYVPSPTAVLLGSAEALRFAGSKVGDVVNPPVAMLSLEDDQPHLLLEAKAFIKELAEEAGEPVPEVDDDTLEQVIDALLHHGGDDETEQLAQGDDNPEWTAYQGTHGGRGWKNVRTGEVLYQEEKPGTRGDGKQDDATPKNPAQPQQDQQGQEQQDPAKEAQRQQAKADYKQNGVRAKSFKSWFGDWEKDPKNASKVVDPKTGEPLGTHPLPDHTSKVSDETGRPIAVFHGTPGGKFSEFRKDKLRDPEALNYGPGFYFTDKKDVAEGYAKGESGTAQGEVMTVFLNIRKPFKVGANKKYTQEEYDAILGNKPGFFGKLGRKINGPQTYTGDRLYSDLVKKTKGRVGANAHLEKMGFDGIHDDALNGKSGVSAWIAFNSNQIKAADNEGTFDPNDNKIHMAMPEAGAWTHYQGPHGGHGWKNGATGEVVYQEEMPGSRGSDGRTGTPSPQAFKAWFGDSKVVDESGNPKFAYHGTTKDFDTFDRDKGLSVADKLGSWFSTDPNFAEARLRHRIDGMTGGASQGDLPQGSAMVRTYLSIRKPLELPSRKALDQYLDKNIVMPDDLLNKYKKQIIATWKDNADPDDEKDREKLKARIASFDHYATDENARQLINNMAHSIAEDKGEEGSFVTLARESLKDYDGIHILDDQGHGEAWVAFKPNQIKNKENSGAFNPDDPRINMAMPVIIDDAIRQRVRKLARKKYPGATEHLAQGDEWTRYQGPHGGHGWKRGSTGEIVYQEEMPGSHAKSAEAKSATTSAPPAVGDVMQFPATPNGRRAFSLKVKSVDDNHAVLGFANNEGGDFKIPAESLKQYRDDMMGIVDVPAGSDIPEINAVAQGKAKLLGHGDDGMAFDAGDKIVKVSSVVPFHPINHVGQRTPEEAIEQARQQFQTAKEMYQAGIPGIPKQSVRQVGDKVFTVREKLDIPKKFTPEQVKQVRQSLDAMHRAGYTLNDDIQVGIGKDGKVYHFDTGKAAKAGHPDDYDDDSHKFERFAEANGVESFPLAHYAEKQFASTEKRASKLGEHEAKTPGFAKSHLSFLKRMHQGMLEGNPERADEINRRYEEAVAKITGKS